MDGTWRSIDDRVIREDGDLERGILARSSPLADAANLDPLLARIGDARYVLLGEASHGTHEYYLWRARLSRRLIEEKGFSFIAVEGDWPDCFRANCYARGESDDRSSTEALAGFTRWPTWMWANWEVAALVEWLRGHNRHRSEGPTIGFFGLDVYSLRESLQAIVGFLDENHPEAVEDARRAFRCFEALGGDDPQEYALATRLVPASCEQEVLSLLREVRGRVRAGAARGDLSALDAETNAEVVRGAEAYYRTMIQGGPGSWNLRDRHMAATLDRLMAFHGPEAKAIVWAHNTHIGDARQTDMAEDGMLNLGQIVREEHPAEGVVLVGFGSHEGSVIAGRGWDAPMEEMPVPPARPGSWEAALHRLGGEDRLLIFPGEAEEGALATRRGHRAIGVVYRPEAEWGNYVPTVLPLRYDAFLYLDRTRALHPLPDQADDEPPELYPWNA